MCLIVKELKDKEGKSLVPVPEYCRAFKVVTHDNQSLFRNAGLLHNYEVGINVSSRTPETKDVAGEVNAGFHIALDIKGANKLVEMFSVEKPKILEIFYKPEDVVGYGLDHCTQINAAVVTKLLVVSLYGVKQ